MFPIRKTKNVSVLTAIYTTPFKSKKNYNKIYIKFEF